jgi:hypothetical protein
MTLHLVAATIERAVIMDAVVLEIPESADV